MLILVAQDFYMLYALAFEVEPGILVSPSCTLW